MRIDAVYLLVATTLATSVSILMVGLVREPLRSIAGPQIAYWLWSLVPIAAIAALLPAPSLSLPSVTEAASVRVIDGIQNVMAVPRATANAVGLAAATMSIWVLGSLVMFGLLLHRHRALVRALGAMTPGPEGARYSRSISGPMLVGVRRPYIVLPADFESRYDPHERALMLEHEASHLRRGDPLANAIASVWLCLCWFNPLMYWALGRFRLDQELACDAMVLRRSDAGPRRYAEALLRTQLAVDSPWEMSAACRWKSNHPLTERIAVIRRPRPGVARRLSGVVTLGVLAVSSGCAVLVAHSELSGRAGDSLNFASPVEISANSASLTPGGEARFSGNVVFKAAGLAAHVHSARARVENGATVLEDVRVRFGGGTLRASRAILKNDELSMESAVIFQCVSKNVTADCRV